MKYFFTRVTAFSNGIRVGAIKNSQERIFPRNTVSLKRAAIRPTTKFRVGTCVPKTGIFLFVSFPISSTKNQGIV